jgi:hypothetical protein
MQWLEISKYKIFLISLNFENIYKLTNVVTKNLLWKSLFNVYYIFVKLDGSSKMKYDIPNSTTQDGFCPRSLKNMLRSL